MEKQKNKHIKKSNIKGFVGNIVQILRLFGQFKKQLFIALIFAVCATLFSVIGPKILADATNVLFYGAVDKANGAGGINFYMLLLTLFEAALIYIVASVCRLIQGIVGTNVSRKICFDLRSRLIKKINKLPVSYFEGSSKGDTLSRIINDVDMLGQNIAEVFINIVTTVTMLVGSLVMMFLINWWIALIVLILVPLCLFFVGLVVRFSQGLFVGTQNKLGKVNGYIEESFAGHEVIQAYNKQRDTVEHFNEINEDLYKTGLKARIISLITGPLMTILNNLCYVVVVIIGAILTIQGQFTVGDIQAFLQYVNNFTGPLGSLMGIFSTVQQMAASCERVYAFLELEDEVDETHMPPEPDINAPIVSFKHVDFSYDKKIPIINDFNLDVKEGQTVAIVGPTGAGKTTIMKLMLRYYDPDKGCIEIRGTDSTQMSRAEARENFVMVLQDLWLFRGTVAQNIRYGDLDATDIKLHQASQMACADEFIQRYSKKYDTMINENATNISQGQKQLLSIARAIIADRDIMIFDEATSSVDSSTEKKLYEAFDNLIGEKTCFVIAHRLSTVRNADVILVLNNGDVIEQGSHEELIAQKGFYYDLYKSGLE